MDMFSGLPVGNIFHSVSTKPTVIVVSNFTKIIQSLIFLDFSLFPRFYIRFRDAFHVNLTLFYT